MTVTRRSNLRRCSLLLAFVPLFALPAGPAQSAWTATVTQAEADDLLRYRKTGQQPDQKQQHAGEAEQIGGGDHGGFLFTDR